MRISSSRQRRRILAFHCITAVALVLGLLCTNAPARALFKCTLPDGKVAFKDTPCDTESAQQEIQMRAGTQKAVDTPAPAELASKEAPAAAPEPVMVPKASAPTDCSNWAPPPGSVDVAAPKPDAIGVARSDPMFVVNACSAMLAECTKKGGDPNTTMDACFKAAPRCATSRPWEEATVCCPESCFQKYSGLRRKCVDPSSASTRVLYDEHCAPGAVESLQDREGR